MRVPGETEATPSRASLPAWARAADVLTVFLLAVSTLNFVAPVHVEALRLTMRHWERPFLAALAVAVVRHLYIRQPSLRAVAADTWSAVRERWPGVWAGVAVTVVTRPIVLLAGYLAVVMIPFPADAPFQSVGVSRWWDLPNRWDAGWYVSVALNGYHWSGSVADQQNLAFFPAYPFAVRVLSRILPVPAPASLSSWTWAATEVSILAFLLACVYLYRIANDAFGSRIAVRAVVLIASYPFAVFYSTALTESLFLLCCVAAWYHIGREQPWPAAAWGAVAGLCRPNGAMLAVALLVLVWTLRRTRAAPVASGFSRTSLWIAALCPVFGALAFHVYAYMLTGRPLVLVELQREAWNRAFQGLNHTVWTELSTLADIGMIQYIALAPARAVNVAATILALASVWPVTRRVGIAAGVFVLVNTLLPLTNGGFSSMGRYTSVLFPMFIWMATALEDSMTPLVAAVFGIGQALVAVMFFTWRPIY